jgi:mRNA interferase MazF
MVVKRFEVWLINLDPTVGSEIKKSRPCLIVSPEAINKYLNTIIAAPMTSTIKGYPTRVACTFQKINGEIALDQVRAVDKKRLIKKLGSLDTDTNNVVCEILQEMFEY